DQIAVLIRTGTVLDGDRLPPPRELAGQLVPNRTHLSTTYEILESEGMTKRHVGRGSYVHYSSIPSTTDTSLISFASSRPAQDDFPVAAFQTTCREVISGPTATAILQLGSPAGFPPLRHYLLKQAREEGTAGPDD